jgi:uncharacterized protein YkwD
MHAARARHPSPLCFHNAQSLQPSQPRITPSRMAALTPDIEKVETAIVEMTNAFRAQQKLGTVKAEPKLSAAARKYAEFLAASDLFSHTADGRQHADRAKLAGYRFCMLTENLAYNYDTRGFETRQLASQAMEGWKKSPGHLKNLVAPHVIDIGVGVAKAKGAEKYYSVQMFGRPDGAKYAVKIQNGLSQSVTYMFTGHQHQIAPREVVTHYPCQPETLVFERAGPPLVGRALTGSYQTRDGELYTLKSSASGGVIIDVTSNVAEPAKANTIGR